MIYRIDEEPGKLIPHEPPWVDIHPGAGPRHFAFHPSYQYAYVINEVDSTLTAFAYDGDKGTLSEVQTLSTLPGGCTVPNTTADLHVAPSGRFVYGSNRGHDSIAIFAVDPSTGTLSPIGHESTLGKTPRNFGLDESGTLLLAANQDTDSVVSFRVDPETGQLTPTGHAVEVSMPVCVKTVSLG
jgi:6-phosphogluconolactonase